VAKLQHIEWDEKSPPAENAARHLPEMMAAYFAEGRGLMGDAEDPDKLHRLRLISKRVRYTLELFAPCYGAEIQEGLAAIKRLQDVLGELNDAVATWRLIGPMRGAARMKPILDAQAEARAAEFRQQWREGFDAPGQEQWWIEWLGKSGQRPRGGAVRDEATRESRMRV
jgi:CHAD domain-containing protein